MRAPPSALRPAACPAQRPPQVPQGTQPRRRLDLRRPAAGLSILLCARGRRVRTRWGLAWSLDRADRPSHAGSGGSRGVATSASTQITDRRTGLRLDSGAGSCWRGQQGCRRFQSWELRQFALLNKPPAHQSEPEPGPTQRGPRTAGNRGREEAGGGRCEAAAQATEDQRQPATRCSTGGRPGSAPRGTAHGVSHSAAWAPRAPAASARGGGPGGPGAGACPGGRTRAETRARAGAAAKGASTLNRKKRPEGRKEREGEGSAQR